MTIYGNLLEYENLVRDQLYARGADDHFSDLDTRQLIQCHQNAINPAECATFIRKRRVSGTPYYIQGEYEGSIGRSLQGDI